MKGLVMTTQYPLNRVTLKLHANTGNVIVHKPVNKTKKVRKYV